MIFEFLFWLCVFAVFHSYVLYPTILTLLSNPKKKLICDYDTNENLPKVSILISAFNEEEVIVQKIESVFQNSYPHNLIELLIGSDNSTDKTNQLVSGLTQKYPQISFFPFSTRQGKGNVINQLYDKSTGEIIILTDANVIFDNDTIFELVKKFKDPAIGLVDSNMINIGLKKEGISFQEKAYISREVIIKNQESNIWGTMMGPFGGCYAIRKELYEKVPRNFLVDDFYINMKVLEKGFKAINNINAKVYEDVSNNLMDEFHRKIRIATGNFQNLAKFGKLLFPPFSGLAFSFFSHKVLRWLGPFFIILSLISLAFLSFNSKIYLLLFCAELFTFIIPIIDYSLKKIGIHFALFRFITHFYIMNLALLSGFFKFLKGVESNVWKPTKRNQ